MTGTEWNRAVRAAGALAVAVLVVTGCGSQEQAAPEAETLYEKFGLPDYSDPAQRSAIDDEQRLVEDAIAECMVDKGFEYQPVIYDSGDFTEFTEADAVEQAELYGLGVSLQYNNPAWDEEMAAQTDEFVDPNADYLETLSEAEMQAYYEALDGTPEEMAQYETTEVDPESGETYTVVEGAGAGCRGEAQRSVGSDDQRVYEALAPFETEIQERLDADPRIVEGKAEWSACMSEKGFDYADEEAVYDYAEGPMRERLTEILGGDPFGDPFAAMSPEEQEAFFADKTDAEIQQAYDDYEKTLLEGADLAALTVLQTEERDLAVASTVCSRAMWDATEEIRAEVEAAYLAENGDRIAAAVAELEQPDPSSS